MPLGTIKKLVRMAASTDRGRGGAVASAREGYGIISGHDGEQVFFVDSAVKDGRFDDLERGQCVRYTLEDGPLLRAAIVLPADGIPEHAALPGIPRERETDRE